MASELVSHAKKELAILNKDGDEMQERISENIIDIIETFSKQGHSGTSARYVIDVLDELLRYRPLTPLTGEDSEWNEVGEKDGEVIEQNKRCSSVFRTNKDNARARDVESTIYSRDGGDTWFVGGGMSDYITFPYTPPKKPRKVILDDNQKEER